MSRTHAQGPAVGNYVTIRLTSATAGVQSTDTTVCRFPMMQGFRVSSVSFAALGQTANVTAKVCKNNSVSNLIASYDADAAASARVATSALGEATKGRGTGLRDFVKGDTLDLILTLDGTGVSAAGTVSAWVTGYFTSHITNRAPYNETGQRAYSGPVSGFYDCISLANLRANANQIARSECDFIAPYAGRIMAVTWDLSGHTETAASITGDIRKNTVSILSAALDWDANEDPITDADSTPGFASSAAREFAQGDTLSLYVSSGATDNVGVAHGSAALWVWVKGHVSTTQALD